MLVGLGENALKQGGSNSMALVRGFDADRFQIPVWLLDMGSCVRRKRAPDRNERRWEEPCHGKESREHPEVAGTRRWESSGRKPNRRSDQRISDTCSVNATERCGITDAIREDRTDGTRPTNPMRKQVGEKGIVVESSSEEASRPLDLIFPKSADLHAAIVGAPGSGRRSRFPRTRLNKGKGATKGRGQRAPRLAPARGGDAR